MWPRSIQLDSNNFVWGAIRKTTVIFEKEGYVKGLWFDKCKSTIIWSQLFVRSTRLILCMFLCVFLSLLPFTYRKYVSNVFILNVLWLLHCMESNTGKRSSNVDSWYRSFHIFRRSFNTSGCLLLGNDKFYVVTIFPDGWRLYQIENLFISYVNGLLESTSISYGHCEYIMKFFMRRIPSCQ